MPPTHSRLKVQLALLEPCWTYVGPSFRSRALLGASCCVCCRSWLVCVRLGPLLGRLGLDFGGFRGTPGRILEPHDVDFPWVFRDSELSMQHGS